MIIIFSGFNFSPQTKKSEDWFGDSVASQENIPVFPILTFFFQNGYFTSRHQNCVLGGRRVKREGKKAYVSCVCLFNLTYLIDFPLNSATVMSPGQTLAASEPETQSVLSMFVVQHLPRQNLGSLNKMRSINTQLATRHVDHISSLLHKTGYTGISRIIGKDPEAGKDWGQEEKEVLKGGSLQTYLHFFNQNEKHYFFLW